MADNSFDTQFLQQALDLAAQGIGLASPNPHVGAVIVAADDTVIGRGFHTYAGVKHAEVLAIEQAGSRARGSTIYVNLEPCSHQGRTGPCADAIIAAGISRVVACMGDPNPLVSGRGFARLRDAAIEVEIGQSQEQAKKLNEAFARYIRSHRPLVILKSAMSLDAQIAAGKSASNTAKRGADQWITGDAARAHVQQLRHQSDAILTGIGTILADDPLLTDRSGLPRRQPLLRVVLDSKLRLPLESRIAQSASQNDVLVFCSSEHQPRRPELEERGVRVETIAMHDSQLDLAAAFRRLGELQITSVLCEGGTRINSALLNSGLVDKAFLYYAPKLLRSQGSVPFANVTSPLKLSNIHLHTFGDDFAIEGYLRDPYAD